MKVASFVLLTLGLALGYVGNSALAGPPGADSANESTIAGDAHVDQMIDDYEREKALAPTVQIIRDAVKTIEYSKYSDDLVHTLTQLLNDGARNLAISPKFKDCGSLKKELFGGYTLIRLHSDVFSIPSKLVSKDPDFERRLNIALSLVHAYEAANRSRLLPALKADPHGYNNLADFSVKQQLFLAMLKSTLVGHQNGNENVNKISVVNAKLALLNLQKQKR